MNTNVKEYAVRRVVTVFDKDTEEFITFFTLRNFDLTEYIYWFDVPQDDPLMYDFYEISPVNAHVMADEDILFDFDRNIYYLECSQVAEVYE